MSMLASLAKKWHYSVHHPGAGRLLYREGNREYTFPLYEENGTLILVGVPSSQRIHFFFNWHLDPDEFSGEAQRRILPRLAEYLRSTGARVRIFEQCDSADGFVYYPELMDHRALATQALEESGWLWFRDYSSIDVLHEEYGVEICGIKNESRARCMAAALQHAFPHWHHVSVSFGEQGRDPGWVVALTMFPARACNSGWYDND